MNPESDLEKVSRLIPWGTQTNGKRSDPAMGSSAPRFVERAEGCRFLATNGRWYIDYRSALGPIILGYNHPAVQEAVRRQLDNGVVFSLASPLEYELAERLVGLIPGLEQVRFLKSGNEANQASIRLARAVTSRDLVVTCGYHGHGDWFSCGEGEAQGWAWPREKNGVPADLDRFIVRLQYGDEESLERVFTERGADIAGLMMAPYDWGDNVAHKFVQRARALTTGTGSVLIFDQILTGFRLGFRGAQEFFGIVPDLTTYGKAIANGYPLAAFGGRREVMQALDHVMITTTHAGETLSIAAALATLQVLQSEPVMEHIWSIGTRLQRGFDGLANAAGLSARSFGLPPALQFHFNDDAEADTECRRQFFRSLIEHNIFPNSTFLINYAHKEADIDETLDAMEEGLKRMSCRAQRGTSSFKLI